MAGDCQSLGKLACHGIYSGPHVKVTKDVAWEQFCDMHARECIHYPQLRPPFSCLSDPEGRGESQTSVQMIGAGKVAVETRTEGSRGGG